MADHQPSMPSIDSLMKGNPSRSFRLIPCVLSTSIRTGRLVWKICRHIKVLSHWYKWDQEEFNYQYCSGGCNNDDERHCMLELESELGTKNVLRNIITASTRDSNVNLSNWTRSSTGSLNPITHLSLLSLMRLLDLFTPMIMIISSIVTISLILFFQSTYIPFSFLPDKVLLSSLWSVFCKTNSCWVICL